MQVEQTFIPLSVPNFSGNEKAYVTDAVVSEWVSTGGSRVADFEGAVANYVHMPDAVACNSGTSGLHLAMLVAGIGKHCEVLAPSLTFMAAVNPIRYAGAEPIFIGCDDTLCLCPLAARRFLEAHTHLEGEKCINNATGAHVKGMVIVHVFGNMANMPALLALAKEFHLIVIEDATEALGTYYTDGIFAGKHAGTLGDVGVYSFNGNKLITTGSGGMLVSNHADWAAHARHLSTQAKLDTIYYRHDEIGYNYRMTNLQAALGVAQMEQIEGFIAHKHALYDFYVNALDGKKGFRILPFCEGIRSNQWFFSLYLEDPALDRDTIIHALDAQKIQTRPIWFLIHEQADYSRNEVYEVELARTYQDRVVNIPCSTNLPLSDAQRVADAILALGVSGGNHAD